MLARLRHGLEQAVEVAGHSATDVAVALDELRRTRDLAGQQAVPCATPCDRGEPPVDPGVLLVGAVRDRAQRTEQREQPDAQIPAHGRRLHVLTQRGPAVRPPALGPPREPRDQAVRQDAVDLVEVGLEEVGDDDLAVPHSLLLPNPFEPTHPSLEFGHPHGILVAHPNR